MHVFHDALCLHIVTLSIFLITLVCPGLSNQRCALCPRDQVVSCLGRGPGYSTVGWCHTLYVCTVRLRNGGDNQAAYFDVSIKTKLCADCQWLCIILYHIKETSYIST